MAGLASFEAWIYGGAALMALAGFLAVAQTALFLVKRGKINQKLDEEYGHPQKYGIKGKGNEKWLK